METRIWYKSSSENSLKNPDGSYSTGLSWEAGHPPLRDNAECAKACLGELLRKFKGKPKQINQGTVQYAPDKPEGDHVFYITRKPVIRELAETTKMRIVYDTSARGNQKSPLLNNCLDVGPLQLLLYDVLLQNRPKPTALTADMKQAFHQI